MVYNKLFQKLKLKSCIRIIGKYGWLPLHVRKCEILSSICNSICCVDATIKPGCLAEMAENTNENPFPEGIE